MQEERWERRKKIGEGRRRGREKERWERRAERGEERGEGEEGRVEHEDIGKERR